MKTLRSIMLGLMLIVTCATVKANVPVNESENLTRTYAVNTYVNAMTRGKLDGLNDVLDQSVKFSMLRGREMMNFDKKEMLGFMQKSKNINQDCITSTTVVQSNDKRSLIRVDMKFDNFVRSNYLTVTNTGSGWKITKVYSEFK